MLKIQWRQTASEDLTAIIEYISDENPQAAQSLLDEILEKLGHLPDNPKLYRKGRVENTREIVVRSDYVLVYVEDLEVITILRVLHAAQQWP